MGFGINMWYDHDDIKYNLNGFQMENITDCL